MAATTAGNEVVLKDGHGRLLRLSLKELLFSDRAVISPDGPGPSSDDEGEIASVVLGQLDAEERQKVLERAGHVRQQARQAIPAESFSRRYIDEHRSLQQIATLTGFSRSVVTGLAEGYGIPLREGPKDYKRRGTVERAWLIEQYVHRRRTLPNLAREAGMSTANMARWAHTHNIPLRPRGGASHQTVLRTSDEAEALPVILRKALTGPYARQRLARFLAAQSYPTLTEAAQDLGIHQSALVIQINRLERDLGKALLERAERGRAMKLTPFGEKVIAAISTMQGQIASQP